MNDHPETEPVIVTGAPRTGVRLLAALLDAHPALASGPDLPFLVTMLRQWHDLDATHGTNHLRHYGLPPDRARAAFRASLLRLFDGRLRRTGKPRFVVHSFAASVALQLFDEMFPRARFVVTVRDPRDVTLSLRDCEWIDARSGLPLSCTREAGAAARQWEGMVSLALQGGAAAATGGRLMVLRYEDLCCEPERTLRALGGFLGIGPPRAWVTAESAALVTAALDYPHPPLRLGALTRTRVGRWRHEPLPADQLAAVESSTAELRLRLGYQ